MEVRGREREGEGEIRTGVRVTVKLGPGEPRADGAADNEAEARGGNLAGDAHSQRRPEWEEEAWVTVRARVRVRVRVSRQWSG